MNPVIAAFRARFPDEEAARRYMESVRWPTGPVCPSCGNIAPLVYPIRDNEKTRVRPGLFQCHCRRQFTVTTGTVMHGTRLDLDKWLLAWWLLTVTEEPLSMLKLSRALGVGYTTACVVARRMRSALPRLSRSPSRSKN